MTIDQQQRRAMLSWLFLGALFALCAVLAVLQYRWIGEVSVAARDRLHGSLEATLVRLSQGLNAELATESSALVPQNFQGDPQAAQAELMARFGQWKKSTHRAPLWHRAALAIPRKPDLQLLNLDLDRGSLAESPWPAEWNGLKARLESRLSPTPWDGRNPPPAGGSFTPPREEFTVEAPLFAPPAPRISAAPADGSPFGRRETAWLILELDPAYMRDVLLPEILQRYLGTGGNLDYQVEIAAKTAAGTVIYRSDPRQPSIALSADASASLFDPQQFLWAGGAGNRGPGPGRGPAPDSGRWQIFVRHRAGSLEAVVSQARWRNLEIAAGVLLLIVATAAALIRFTRRTQKLAELQMDFVAGVSHELRTPLTVIHTAAYNLQGKMAHDPGQVERYGALIQQESGRLNALVEQILRFATAERGRVIQEREPLSLESVIEDAVAASRPLVEGSRCVIEKNIAAGLPQVLGDRAALRQALENLVANAAKYGLQGGNWIGVFAARSHDRSPESVEVRVADRGPGIPPEEQEQIFDPFFRGARAHKDQIRGTGLGLSLVKKIVEAHGGSVRVESEPAKGTVFILRLPALPAGAAV
jgi:signal transduction histidine kinase